MKQRQYLSIKQLAQHLGISVQAARWLARSQALRRRKGAVLNVNASQGKYEILRIDALAAAEVYEANPYTYM